MAEATYYRYVGKDGNAHLTDDLSSIPKEHRDSAQQLQLHDIITAAMARDEARHLIADMSWPSFGIGFGVACLVALLMRLFVARRLVFAGIVAVIAAFGFGSAFVDAAGRRGASALFRSMTAGSESTLPNGMLTPPEARKILESLPRAHAERVSAAEKAAKE